MPLAFATFGGRVVVAGQSATTDAASSGDPILMSIVDADYFSVLRLPLVAGRPLVATDNEGTPRVAVVNETFAERYWTDGSALGRSFTYLEQEVTIVGIARDAKYGSLTEVTPAFAYFPIQQSWITSQILLVRSTVPPASLAASIQGAVLAIDPTLPRPVVTTLRESTGIVLLPQRIATLVTASMGGVGLLLATVGLYGIMSFGVGRRSREIGLRMALGADRRSVLRLIILEGMRLFDCLLVVPPSGAIYDYVSNSTVRPIQYDPEAKRTWHQTEILANRTTGIVKVAVNGQARPDYKDPRAAGRKAGPIGLQLHSGGIRVEFKEIFVEVNPKEDRLLTVK
jgi:hypothetical protein